MSRPIKEPRHSRAFGQHEADALAGARRAIHVDVACAAVAHVLTVEAPEENRVAGLAVQQIRLSQIVQRREPRAPWRRPDRAKALNHLHADDGDDDERDRRAERRPCDQILDDWIAPLALSGAQGQQELKSSGKANPKQPAVRAPGDRQRVGGLPDKEGDCQGAERAEEIEQPAHRSSHAFLAKAPEINFRDAARRPAAQLDNHRDDRADIFHDLRLAQLQIRLQRHQRQALESAIRAVGMERRQGAGMAGIDGLEERRRLGATDFAKEQPVGPQSQAQLQQVLNRHLREALPALGGKQRQPVRLRRLELARVFDRDHALGVRDLFEQRIQKSRLARRRSAGDDHRHVVFDGEGERLLHAVRGCVLQQLSQFALYLGIVIEVRFERTSHLHGLERAHLRVVVQVEIGDDLLPDREGAARRRRRREHALKSLPMRHRRRKQGVDEFTDCCVIEATCSASRRTAVSVS